MSSEDRQCRGATASATRPRGSRSFLPRVAFQGEDGAFSEEAALACFAGCAQPVPCATLEALFARVAEGGADYGLAPVENTLFGSVHRTYDLLLAGALHVVGESVLRVRHQLVGCRGATLAGLKAVASHPVALGQCERFLAAHPGLAREESDDTAASVRRACAAGDPTRAAIGSRRAARLYGGEVLCADVQDDPRNYTRFLLLAREPAAPNARVRRHKVALCVELAHRPGTLHRALAPFARRGIDLLRIESRPLRGQPWRYLFYLDVEGMAAAPPVREALAELAGNAVSVRVLGCFPAAGRRRHAAGVAGPAGAVGSRSPLCCQGRKADHAT